MRPIPLVGQKVLDRREEETAKPAPRRRSPGQRVLLQESSEELLRHVLRLARVGQVPADVDVQRIPVALAERRESCIGISILSTAGAEHQAPVGSLETSRHSCIRCLLRAPVHEIKCIRPGGSVATLGHGDRPPAGYFICRLRWL